MKVTYYDVVGTGGRISPFEGGGDPGGWKRGCGVGRLLAA
jgi:hypothetical protein